MATQSQTGPLAVLRMHLLDPPAPALDVFVGRNGEDAAQMFGPIDGAPAHVPVPETLGRTFHRQGEPPLAFPEPGLRTLAFGDVADRAAAPAHTPPYALPFRLALHFDPTPPTARPNPTPP